MTSALVKLCLLVAMLGLAWSWRGGFDDVEAALRTAGWTGLVLVSAYHFISVVLCGVAWRSLLVSAPPGATLTFVISRWVRDGVGQLLSFLPLGGEVAGARLLSRRGVKPAMAGACTVVDVTAEVMAQVVFSLIGVGVWLGSHPGSPVTRWGIIGVATSVPAMVGLVMVQRGGVMRFLETLPSRLMPHVWTAPGLEDGIHAAIIAIWARRRRVATASAVHLFAWIFATGEAWLALRLLGAPLDLPEVLALESLIFAIRNLAFVVPGAWGVQEGSYMVLGAALGLPAEAALALSLLKRGRELVLGLPALLTWQLLGRTTEAAVENG
jgi:putative membrane protein